MEKKLAGLFAFIAFSLFVGAWLVQRLREEPVMPPEDMVTYGTIVLLTYFAIGFGISRVGISLIQEVLADKRIREEEARIRARGGMREGPSAVQAKAAAEPEAETGGEENAPPA